MKWKMFSDAIQSLGGLLMNFSPCKADVVEQIVGEPNPSPSRASLSDFASSSFLSYLKLSWWILVLVVKVVNRLINKNMFDAFISTAIYSHSCVPIIVTCWNLLRAAQQAKLLVPFEREQFYFLMSHTVSFTANVLCALIPILFSWAWLLTVFPKSSHVRKIDA